MPQWHEEIEIDDQIILKKSNFLINNAFPKFYFYVEKLSVS